MGQENIIEIKGLRAGYGDQVVIPDLSVDFARGRITTIAGASGCGKTTLLKCIVGLIRPIAGSITVDGVDLTGLEALELSRAMSRVGMLFQHGAMLNSITVRENVALPLREHTRLSPEVIDEIVSMKLELVGLGHAGSMLPSELSGGMRKRAALARAMALDPDLLLCDEPSAGLDPQTAAGLDQLIIRLKETFRMSVIVVTHELASIKTIADDVVMLGRKGDLRFAGPIEEAMRCDDPELRDFFNRRLPEPPSETRSLYETLGGGMS